MIDPHRMTAIRLGHDAEVRCSCGWSVELHGSSGDETARKIAAAKARHAPAPVTPSALEFDREEDGDAS